MYAAILCFIAFSNISCENPFIEKAFYLTTITFNTNGGSNVPQQKLLMKETVARPADPVKENSVFLGWYTDNETFDHEWDFKVVPEKNMTLYAKWEAKPHEELPNEELTLILDTSELANDGDSVSFSASDIVLETSVSGGDIITVYYTLADTHNVTSELMLFIGNSRIFITEQTGSGIHSYTVNNSHAIDGIITIRAVSIHTNLIVLDEPENVSFNNEGVISFTAGANNAAAGAAYSFTLYRGTDTVTAFTNMSITSGQTVVGLTNEMLTAAGTYSVRVWAQTSNPAYTSVSIDISSAALHVYEVSVIINGNDTDKIIVNGTNYTSSFTIYTFSGSDLTLTATPGTNRYVTWSGDGTGEGNTFTIANITANRTATATFAPYPVAVTVNDVTTNYIDLDAALASINASGNFTVTLYENQAMTANRTINTENQHITIIGAGGVRTIIHGINNAATHMFTISNANASLTLGNNITVQGRSAEGAGAVVNNTNGTFRMLAGSKITGHQSSSGTSAAVNITGANSTFEMSGGIINGNNTSVAITTTTASGGVYFTNGTFTMSGGSISGNTHGAGNPSDVYHAVTTANSFTISGNAAIGSLKLNAANITTNASVTIGAGGWNGGIQTLNLRGSDTAIATAASYWIGRQVFNSINAAQVAEIGLGNFISSNNARAAISSTHFIGTAGSDSGRLTPFIFEIWDEDDLRRVCTGVTHNGRMWALWANYRMMANIDLTGRANWTSIGGSTSATSFVGVFDGNGKTITGMTSTNYGNGMFSIITTGSVVKNLGLENVTIATLNGSIGGIAGENNGTITNSYVTGSISAPNGLMIGGIAGQNRGTIENCYAIVDVSGLARVGGVVGYIMNGAVRNVYAAGTVGGGVNSQHGGICGDAGTNNLVSNAIALNETIDGSGLDYGRVLGFGNGVNNRAWSGMQLVPNRDVTSDPAGHDGANVTTAQLQTRAVWEAGAAFSFGNNDENPWVWENGKMPRLYWETAGRDWPGYLGMYNIGDTGPAGGRIIYHNPAGFTVQGYGSPGDEGYFAQYTAYYLEAAPENTSASTMRWSNTNGLIPNLSQSSSDTTDWAIGRGRLNTALIAAAHPDDTSANNAAKATAAYTGGGKNDWFLPSREELNLIYLQRSQVGITTGYFWSSSQYSIISAWVQHFGDGSQVNLTKDNSGIVRAIRAF